MRRSFCACVLLSCILAHGARAEPPRIAATIGPVHSLASFLLSGTGVEAELLIAGGASPHHFHLRPSGAAILEDADAIFWVSENLEGGLAKAIMSRAAPGASAQLLPALDDALLIHRDNGHEDEHEEEHEEHEEGHEHGEEHEEHEEEGHEHEEEHEEGEDLHLHEHGFVDAHIWLSPELAGEMAAVMVSVLARVDSENAELYHRNLRDLRLRLEELDKELRGMLLGAGMVRAFALHDAYAYFERAYGAPLAGTILDANAETHGGLSAMRVAELRGIAEDSEVRCIFAEPQFSRRMLTPITRGFEMEVLIVDPLGAEFPPGAEAYFDTMRSVAKAFAKCAKE